MTPREVDMKKAVSCDVVPAIGPYSSAVKAGPFIFCSGQIPLVPDTGEVITADVRRATEQAMRNLEAVLAAAGATLADVVKTTIYLVDMGDFPAVNEVYGRFFHRRAPGPGHGPGGPSAAGGAHRDRGRRLSSPRLSRGDGRPRRSVRGDVLVPAGPPPWCFFPSDPSQERGPQSPFW